MSEESDEELCKRLADFMGCKVKELRGKDRKEIIVTIPRILPEGDYSEEEILDIIKRLESAGCVPSDLHEELGPP
jgi:hypothetical protein